MEKLLVDLPGIFLLLKISRPLSIILSGDLLMLCLCASFVHASQGNY